MAMYHFFTVHLYPDCSDIVVSNQSLTSITMNLDGEFKSNTKDLVD